MSATIIPFPKKDEDGVRVEVMDKTACCGNCLSSIVFTLHPNGVICCAACRYVVQDARWELRD